MKQADELQPWTLSFRARAKRCRFKFKYSKICKLFRLSIRFKLRPFTFEFESRPESAFSFNPKLFSLGLKFLHKLKSLRRNRSGNKRIVSTWLHRKNCWIGRRKYGAWFWVLLLAVMGCFVIMQLRSFFRSRFLWNFFWMAWNYAAPSGFLHQLFKVILDGLSRYLGF